ncbi:MAG: hypothetical protein SH820_17580, partial [Xanthomonadales bacterium]|nr:hypothetical protein [Xanthomonadales bacterium]
VLLLLGGEKSHDVTAACPLTKFVELHLRVESKKNVNYVWAQKGKLDLMNSDYVDESLNANKFSQDLTIGCSLFGLITYISRSCEKDSKLSSAVQCQAV